MQRLRRDVASELRAVEMDFSPFPVRFARRRLLLVASRLWAGQLSLFAHLHSPKPSKTGGFACTDRKMAARMDFCPHEPEVGSHGTTKCPHRSNFHRTEGKMAARNDFCPHGGKDSPHGSIPRVWEPIFARTEGLWTPPKASGSCARPI
jgi:hypothetical protein